MHTFTDEQLIAIFQNTNGSRKKKAFDYLYLRYSQPVKQYFYFTLNKDYEKANDFFHDLFLKLLETPGKFDASKQFKPWLFRVAANMCRNEYRKHEVTKRFMEYSFRKSTVYVELNETEKLLSESIKKLGSGHRSLIVLRFKIKLSIKEIAEIYECPEGTIKSRLFYATKELSKHYKE